MPISEALGSQNRGPKPQSKLGPDTILYTGGLFLEIGRKVEVWLGGDRKWLKFLKKGA